MEFLGDDLRNHLEEDVWLLLDDALDRGAALLHECGMQLANELLAKLVAAPLGAACRVEHLARLDARSEIGTLAVFRPVLFWVSHPSPQPPRDCTMPSD